MGSSLTAGQTVECEAGYMSSKGLIFGSVGALTNSKHPSILAKKLAMKQLEDSKLVPPICLVGNGANDFSLECEDVPTCSNNDLITERSRRVYEKSKAMLDQRGWDTASRNLYSYLIEACFRSGPVQLK